MKLGFHYHLPAIIKNGNIFTAGYLGVFLDGLSIYFNEIYLFLHSPLENELESLTYKIKSKNINLIDIGPHYRLHFRLLTKNLFLYKYKSALKDIDVFLVRGPTPLLFQFYKIYEGKFSIYLVGDYVKSLKNLKLNPLKKYLLYIYYRYYNYKQSQILKKNKVIVNSREIMKSVSSINENSVELKTTTIMQKELFFRADTCQNEFINILYTGRIDPAKGIFEILEACSILIEKNYKINVHFAGMTYQSSKVIKELKDCSQNLGIENNFIFHGELKIGQELNSLYQSSDIYVIASKAEGFPRTIWEAMANCCPVISTKVGSIPYFLKNNHDSILIDNNENNTKQIASSIEKLINDNELRIRIIKNGYRLAKLNTIELQSKKLAKILKS